MERSTEKTQSRSIRYHSCATEARGFEFLAHVLRAWEAVANMLMLGEPPSAPYSRNIRAYKHKHFMGISLPYWASLYGGLYEISLSLFLLMCFFGALRAKPEP